jgi:hypothetical protein
VIQVVLDFSFRRSKGFSDFLGDHQNLFKKSPGRKIMSEQDLRNALYGSFKNRAMMYYHIFDELRKEIGEERATAIMKRAIYKRGLQIGKPLAKYGPDDLEGLKNAFLGLDPDEGRMFSAEILRSDAEGVDIKFHRCPLREAWQEAGLSDEETAKICAIAARVDNGTFEGAGFEFYADTWKAEQGNCCYLHIRLKKGGKKRGTIKRKKSERRGS